MADMRSWWRKPVEWIAEKIVDKLLGLVTFSGVVAAAAYWWAHLGVASWVLAGLLAVIAILAHVRARQLARENEALRRSVDEAADRTKREVAEEQRAAWTDEVALQCFGLEVMDAWCFVQETQDSWSIHMAVRPWSAIPYQPAIALARATFQLDDGWEVASCDPNLSWNPLELGVNQIRRVTTSLSQNAAERIRSAAKCGGRVLASAVVAVSLRLDGGPPTDPDRYRRKLELLLRVQS
jgi:hypothetical protein